MVIYTKVDSVKLGIIQIYNILYILAHMGIFTLHNTDYVELLLATSSMHFVVNLFC